MASIPGRLCTSNAIPNTANCIASAPQKSIATSRGVLVRPGIKLWCHSSQLANSNVENSASPPAFRNRTRHCVQRYSKVTRQASKKPRLTVPYPTKCPVFRM